jgi:hypothetical protein
MVLYGEPVWEHSKGEEERHNRHERNNRLMNYPRKTLKGSAKINTLRVFPRAYRRSAKLLGEEITVSLNIPTAK